MRDPDAAAEAMLIPALAEWALTSHAPASAWMGTAHSANDSYSQIGFRPAADPVGGRKVSSCDRQ